MDHSPVLGKITNLNHNNHCISKPFNRHIFHYDNGDYVKLQSLINDTPWNSLLSGDIDDMYYTFVSLIRDFSCECIPNFVVKIHPRDKPGMTTRIKRLFKQANKLHKKASNSKLPSDILNHKNARRLAKCEWKKAKFDYYYKLNLKLMGSNTSDRAWWKLCKIELGVSKSQSIPCLYDEGHLVFDDELKCTILNNYFAKQCNIAVPLEAELSLQRRFNDLDRNSGVVLEDIVTNEEEIISILKTFNVTKSSGSDEIGNILLNRCCYSISVPLCIIFNNCLQRSVIPSVWKKADVIPIHKRDDPTDCRNYRPISLLSPTSKVLERIIFNRLYEFCMSNNLLTYKNSGFKKRDSTVNQLIHLSHLIYKGLDDGKKIAAVFLDLSKAFDRVWHEGLLYKMERIGI